VTDQTAEHYERLADTYNEHWTYNPDYVRGFSHAMTDVLRLTRSDAIADIGCGTGLYTRQIYEDVRPTRPILCVDPVQAMLSQLPVSPGLTPLLAHAEDLASGRVAVPGAAPLDAIILKESIHHMADRQGTFDGLVTLLSRHGRVLIVMLPKSIQHPLFEAAHERFEQLQPDPSDIADMVAAAGLRSSVSYRTFHAAIERDRYIHMLESRYMSVLGEFSEDELRAGIEQFRHSYRDDPVLRFDDHFAFVKGTVPPR
jgi:trans-aconitate methyltransferase